MIIIRLAAYFRLCFFSEWKSVIYVPLRHSQFIESYFLPTSKQYARSVSFF